MNINDLINSTRHQTHFIDLPSGSLFIKNWFPEDKEIFTHLTHPKTSEHYKEALQHDYSEEIADLDTPLGKLFSALAGLKHHFLNIPVRRSTIAITQNPNSISAIDFSIDDDEHLQYLKLTDQKILGHIDNTEDTYRSNLIIIDESILDSLFKDVYKHDTFQEIKSEWMNENFVKIQLTPGRYKVTFSTDIVEPLFKEKIGESNLIKYFVLEKNK